MQNKFRKISALLLLAMFCLEPFSASAATLSVDLSTPIQNDFLGVNAVYHGFAFMPEQVNAGMNDADRTREFGRVSAIGLNVARTWYRPDWAGGSTIFGTYNWNSAKMTAFYSWLQEMKNRNVDVALNLGWWFMDDTYMGHSSPNATTDPAQYAAWVSESLNQLITVRGFTNIKYGILFTEPTLYDVVSPTPPSGYTLWSYYVAMVKAINNKLVTDGRRSLVKLVGPNNPFAGKDIDKAVADLNNQIDIYSGHDYAATDYNGWYAVCNGMKTAVASTGKPYWMDEWGKPNEAYRQTVDYGNFIAQGISGCINAGSQTLMNWILFDQKYVAPIATETNGDGFYNGVQRWGLTKWPHDSIANPTYPYPAWYAFNIISKYFPGRNGAKTYKTTNNSTVYISALKTQAGDYSFLVVNGNASSQSITVNLSSAINKTLYRYVYDPATVSPTEAATVVGSSKTFNNVTTSFTDTIVSSGVAVYSSINQNADTTAPSVPTGLSVQ